MRSHPAQCALRSENLGGNHQHKNTIHFRMSSMMILTIMKIKKVKQLDGLRYVDKIEKRRTKKFLTFWIALRQISQS
jgi:hypothetical protein